MRNYSDLDQIDRAILAAMGKDGRLSVTDLASQVGLSKTPCQIRLKRLMDEDFIQGFKARLNPAKMGLEHVAFVEVRLSSTAGDALNAFNRAVLAIDEIEQCHMIAGEFDYLLKVRTNDMNSYRRVLSEQVSQLPYVSGTSTHVSMQPIKDEIA